MAAFRLLDLPPEIREQIWRLLSHSPVQPISLSSSWMKDLHSGLSLFPSNLLLTNQQLYHEIRPLFFSINTFCATIFRRNDSLEYFIASAFGDYRRQIRKMQLTFRRGGRYNWYESTLAPLLEDMILNGSLRDLEIRVTESWYMRAGGGAGSSRSEGWVACIRGLLADPYLDRAVLLVARDSQDDEEAEGLLRTPAQSSLE